MELFKKNEAFYLEKRESVMRTRSRKRMEEIEGFVNEYTMKNHCSPSIQAIADAMVEKYREMLESTLEIMR